ncbi:MAG: MATE family efflux transporter [Lachnospiraceae bacterium]|nr:MATE family efflux transporter [Lachnospiraceae bacterium]
MAQTKAVLTQKDKAYRDLSLNGNMWKVILQVGIPLALYQSLSQAFNILDTMMASHISPTSVSAVAYLTQIGQLLSALGGGLAVGAGVQISMAYGKGDYELVRKRVSTLYVICVTMGLLVLGVILPFTDHFLYLTGMTEDLIAAGRQYFIVQLFAMVIQFMNNVYIAVERARGNSKRILYLNMLVIAVKLSLTAFFIYGLEGDLVMIAIATLVSQACLLIFAVMNSVGKGDNAFGFSIRAVVGEREVIGPMVSRSIPVVVEKMAFALGKILVNAMSTIYDSLTVGALGVSNNIGGIVTMPQNGFQEGGASVIGQNLGAGNPKRALDAYHKVLIINMVMGTCLCAFTIWKLDFISSLFQGGDPAFQQKIEAIYKYEALGAITLGMNAAVLSLLYGMGKTKITLVMNFARVFIFRVPVLWFLQHFTDYGSESVGIVMMVSNVSAGVTAMMVAAAVIYFSPEFKNCVRHHA